MIKRHGHYETTLSDGVLYVRLLGEIDHHSAVNIRVSLDGEITRLVPKQTVLDLSEIEFMDSSGLGLIMGRYSLMQKLGGTLSLKKSGPYAPWRIPLPSPKSCFHEVASYIFVILNLPSGVLWSPTQVLLPRFMPHAIGQLKRVSFVSLTTYSCSRFFETTILLPPSM